MQPDETRRNEPSTGAARAPATAPPATVVGATPFECPGCQRAVASPVRRVRTLPAGFAVVTCSQCGVEWQWPRPTPADLERLYSREYYDAWGIHDDEDLVRRTKMHTFDRLLARLERYVAPGALLDVGCATGFLLEAGRRRGWEPYGVELSAYSSAVAQQRFGAQRIKNARLEDADFPDGFFTALTMTDLLEHVLDPVGTLRIAHRLLKTGGAVCLSTPRVGSLSYVLMGRRWTQYKLEHLQYYSPRVLARVLGAVGFAVVECRTWPKTVTLEYVHAQFARYRHWLISPAVATLTAVLPRRWRAQPFSVPLGDMLAIAVRRG